MSPRSLALEAIVALAVYVAIGYLMLFIVRRKRPSFGMAVAIGVGGAIGTVVTGIGLLPFGKLDADFAVIGYFVALLMGAILGSWLALRSIERRA